jgi:hypothetical protein
MPLLAHNRTTSIVTLPGTNPTVALPVALAAGGKGPAVNVTSELRGLTATQYAAIRALVVAGKISIAWEGEELYATGTLLSSDAVAAVEIKPPIDIKIALFDAPEAETGEPRSIAVCEYLPYPARILSVTGAIRRGAAGAQVYLCEHPDGSGSNLLSDRFDASQVGMLVESSVVHDRILDEGCCIYACASTDYVLGHIVLTLQPL